MGPLEKVIFMISIFLFAVGFGLVVDGKKMSQRQIRESEDLDYRIAMNPYQLMAKKEKTPSVR